MRRRGLLLGIAIVIVTNAFVLLGVARNRASAESTLELTEREAVLRTHGKENTGLSLALSWKIESEWDERSWFDRATLAACGFDVSVPVDDVMDGNAPSSYESRLHRPAWVVYELDGASWDRWRARRESEHAEKIAEMRRDARPDDDIREAEAYHARRMAAESRLFAIDAGADRAALRERYPDRALHAIVPSEVSIGVRTRHDPETSRIVERWLQGNVHRPLVSELHVTPGYRPLFVPLTETRRVIAPEMLVSPGRPIEESAADGAPRYAVTVSWGARGEPWIVSAEALSGARAARPDEAPPRPATRPGAVARPREETPDEPVVPR